MPELPEIETVKLGIEKTVLGSAIISTKIFRRDLRFPIEENFEKLILKKRVLGVGRRSKYLLFFLSNKTTIVLHLGMSGRINLSRESKNKYEPKKHDHLIISFDNQFLLIYNDTRRFGFIETIEGDYADYQRFKYIGIEPLSKKFDEQHLWSKIKNSSRSLKNILMDQKVVAGLGNIYVSEALWDCRIKPTRIGKKMSLIECERLVASIKKVLNKAIKFGGTTLTNCRFMGKRVKHVFGVNVRVL